MITKEMETDILRDYNNRDISMRELESKYHTPRAKIAQFAVEHGAEPRRPKMYGKTFKKSKATICPKCKKRIDVKGARFCCFCGADVRSEKEKLCERLDKAIQNTEFLPQNMRDEMRDVLIAAIKEIKR